MVLTIVIITDAIAETMVLMIPPMVETTEPCENVSARDYGGFRRDLITIIEIDRRRGVR